MGWGRREEYEPYLAANATSVRISVVAGVCLAIENAGAPCCHTAWQPESAILFEKQSEIKSLLTGSKGRTAIKEAK